MQLKKGEVLCLVDLEGSGIEEFKKIIFGEEKNYSGSISINNNIIRKLSSKRLFDNGVVLIDEDPGKTTLFKTFNVIDNLCFPLGNRISNFWNVKRYKKNISLTYKNNFSEDIFNNYISSMDSYDLHSLSYLRWHLYSPDIIILIKPFTSVERQLHVLTMSLIDLLVNKGIGVLILTSNVWELSTLSRIIDINIQRIHPNT